MTHSVYIHFMLITAYVRHDSFAHVSWLIQMCDLNHAQFKSLDVSSIRKWNDFFIGDMSSSYVTWLIHMWHDQSIWNMTHEYVTWPIYMWHDSSICAMTHPYVTWLIHIWHDQSVCNMTHPYLTRLMQIWHGSSICDMTYPYVTWHIHGDMSYTHVCHDSSTRHMAHWSSAYILSLQFAGKCDTCPLGYDSIW